MIERLRVRILAGAAGEFSSPELTFGADSYSVHSTPVLLQWHINDANLFARSEGGRLHLNTHYTSLVQQLERADYVVQA